MVSKNRRHQYEYYRSVFFIGPPYNKFERYCTLCTDCYKKIWSNLSNKIVHNYFLFMSWRAHTVHEQSKKYMFSEMCVLKKKFLVHYEILFVLFGRIRKNWTVDDQYIFFVNMCQRTNIKHWIWKLCFRKKKMQQTDIYYSVIF